MPLKDFCVECGRELAIVELAENLIRLSYMYCQGQSCARYGFPTVVSKVKEV